MNSEQLQVVTEEDVSNIHHFYNALMNAEVYYESDPENQQWEYFLIAWLNGNKDDCSGLMELFFDTFQSTFPCYEYIYRGMNVKKGTVLEPKAFASFSKQEFVAENFAGLAVMQLEAGADNYESYMFQIKSERALDLDSLLGFLYEKTSNEDMLEAINQFAWEEEVIAPLTKETLDLMVKPVFPTIEGEKVTGEGFLEDVCF